MLSFNFSAFLLSVNYLMICIPSSQRINYIHSWWITCWTVCHLHLVLTMAAQVHIQAAAFRFAYAQIYT